MDEFNGSPGSLVADVDCTAEGQSLCEKHEAARCKKHLEGVAALHQRCITKHLLDGLTT